MSVIRVSAEVDAPPERVWAVVSDPKNLPVWDRHIVSVSGVPKDGLQTGTSYQAELGLVGVRVKVEAKVLEIRPPEYSRIHVAGVLDATVESWVEPLDGGRTEIRHRIDYHLRGGPLGNMVAAAVNMLGAQALLRRGVQAQKAQAEGKR